MGVVDSEEAAGSIVNQGDAQQHSQGNYEANEKYEHEFGIPTAAWDFMQLWDGMAYSFEKLSNPGLEFKAVRNNTKYAEEGEHVYLIRDNDEGEDLVNVLRDIGDGYEILDENEIDEGNLDYEKTSELDLNNLTQDKLAELAGSYRKKVGSLESPDTSIRGAEFEQKVSNVLKVPNYFELGEIQTYDPKDGDTLTRAGLLNKLIEADENVEGSISIGNDNDYNLPKHLDNAINSLFDTTFNKVKTAAGLNTNKKEGNRIYQRPENLEAFEEIDNPEAAYWLGFLYGDGYKIDRNNNLIGLNLSVDSAHIVQEFKDFIGAGNPIKYKERDAENESDVVSYEFSSEKMYDDLDKWGIRPQKTHHLEWVNDYEKDLPEKYIPDFVRGLMDSDGSIDFQREQDSVDSLLFSICANMPILEKVRSNLTDEIDCLNEVKFNGDEYNGSELRYTGNRQVPKIAKWLFQNVDDGSDPFMIRKVEKVVEHDPDYQQDGHGEDLEDAKEILEPLLEDKKDKTGTLEEICENLENRPNHD